MSTTSLKTPHRAGLRRGLGALCVGILLAGGAWAWRAATKNEPVTGWGPPAAVGHLESGDLDESSGLAASHRNRGLLWTLNSDPQDQILFCVRSDGSHCGAWELEVAQEGDWEAIAIGPGTRSGHPYVYIGDVGDNSSSRTEVVVYRIPEPEVEPRDEASSESQPARSVPVEELRMTYPDGPHDAETLMVHPRSGDIYLVTKHESLARVYKATPPPTFAGSVSLEQLTSIRSEAITDGSISPDGRRVILCTKVRGYELLLPRSEGFDSIWEQEITPVTLVPGEEREGCAYQLDGDAILMTSEGLHTQLYQVIRRARFPANDRRL